MNLNKLSKSNIIKIQKLLTIISEALELKPQNKKTVLIPKTEFKNHGLLISEGITIINKIESEENGLINNIKHTRPSGPRRYPSFLTTDLFNPEEEYKREKKEYEEKYEDNLDINVNDAGKLRKLLENVIERQDWLICDKLKFNIRNGDAVCGKIKTNFTPGSQQFKLLKVLMESPNTNFNYEEISKTLPNKKGGRDVSFVIRDIKEKLKMTGKKTINKNKFRSKKGCQIVCNP